MGIIHVIASIPSEGDILNAPEIQIAALLCILFKFFMWYDKEALL